MQYKGYTIEVVGRTENGRAFLVDVKATKDDDVKERQFDGIVSIDGLRGAVKGWVDTEELKITLPDRGVVDFTEPTPELVQPTQAELDKAEWDRDRERLRIVMELVRDGVLSADATQVTALQTKVRNGLKSAYIG